MGDIKFPKAGTETPERHPDLFSFDLENALDLLPDSIVGTLKEMQSAIEARCGKLVAMVASGAVSLILTIATKTPEALGAILGALDAYREMGAVAAKAKIQPGILDARDLVSLVFRRRLDPGEYLQEAARNGLNTARANNILAALTPQLTVADVQAMLRRALVDDETARLYIRDWGFGPTDGELLKKLARDYLSVGEIVTLWLREEISEANFHARLRELGYLDRERDNIKSLAFFIPPIPDLIRMAYREVFSPEQRKLLDLDAEFPEDFAKWAKRQGVSREWATSYWAAHWELPSPTQAFEMHHRTTFTQMDPTSPQLGVTEGKPYYKVISLETLKQLLKAQDYAPTWRDKLEAISYNPLTRVDVRRMRSLGILDKEGVKKAYYDDGYNEENAQRLADFVEKDVRDDFTGKVKSQMYTMFRRGYVTEPELREYMTRAHIPVEFHDDLIGAELELQEAERLEKRIKAIEKQFKRGIITRELMLLRLTTLDLHSDTVLHLSTLWVEEKLANQQRIGIKDLKEAFGAGIITESKFRQELTERNFQEDDIDIFVKYAGPISTVETEPELTS